MLGDANQVIIEFRTNIDEQGIVLGDLDGTATTLSQLLDLIEDEPQSLDVGLEAHSHRVEDAR